MNVITRQPRKGRPRTQRIPVDRGTPELRAKRLMLVGNADPVLAEYPLGVLFARNIIDLDQRTAGHTFGWLYAKAHGKTHELGFFDPPERAKGLQDEDDLARIERRYCEAKRCLVRISVKCCQLVEDIAVYRVMPPWVGSKEFRIAWYADKETLKIGLSELVKELL